MSHSNVIPIIAEAAKPFVLNPDMSDEQKRIAWRTAVHEIFCRAQVCGCKTKKENCFLALTSEQQEAFLPPTNQLSFQTFCKIVEEARETLVQKLFTHLPPTPPS